MSENLAVDLLDKSPGCLCSWGASYPSLSEDSFDSFVADSLEFFGSFAGDSSEFSGSFAGDWTVAAAAV